ncbi:hypothetical protein H1R20_g11150, partial [Candolleomyces eurysporus]
MEKATGSRNMQVRPCDPSIFNMGDIVDMVFSFVGIPVKDGMYKVILNLHGLMMVNAELQKESVKVELAGDCAPALHVTAPKHQRLYLDAATSSAVVVNKTATTPDGKGSGGASPKHLTVKAISRERGMLDVVENMQRMEVDCH